MSENQIRQLLSEFHYYKNTLDDTLQFLLYMCYNIVELTNKGGK